MDVHNHPPYRPVCPERVIDGRLVGRCMLKRETPGMEYHVTVDFGDHAIQPPRICKSLSEMTSYLETIPGMIGFELHHRASVKIETKYPELTARLPLETGEVPA